MVEKAAITAQKHEANAESPVSRMEKPQLSQFMRSPVDRLVFLQRTHGNQALLRLLKSHVIQAKLRVGEPGDKYEQEADRVAERVVSSAPIQRKCISCNKDEDEKKLVQRKVENTSAAASVPDGFIRNLGEGQPLDPATRAFFEPRFGHDFGGVRVHTDARAAEAARAVNARAFTVGRDVVFGEGEYASDANEERRLVAHELTHVVQQGQADVFIAESNGKIQIAERSAVDLRCAVATKNPQVVPSQIATNPPVPIATFIRRMPDGSVIIKSEIGSSVTRKGYEGELLPAVEVGLYGWHRAHSWGAGFGAEAKEGILYAPPEVNLGVQNTGIERYIRDLQKLKASNVKFFLTTETEAHPRTLRLKSINYQVEAWRGGKRTILFDGTIEVENKTDQPRISTLANEYAEVEQFLRPIPITSSGGEKPTGKQAPEKSTAELEKQKAELMRGEITPEEASKPVTKTIGRGDKPVRSTEAEKPVTKTIGRGDKPVRSTEAEKPVTKTIGRGDKPVRSIEVEKPVTKTIGRGDKPVRSIEVEKPVTKTIGRGDKPVRSIEVEKPVTKTIGRGSKTTPAAKVQPQATFTEFTELINVEPVGMGAMIIHSGLVQWLNEQQAEKAEAEFERLLPDIESFRSKGEWVQVFIVSDVPEKFNILAPVTGPIELTEMTFFKKLYIKHGRTKEEALNPPTTIGPLLVESKVWEEPLEKPKKGRKWIDGEYSKLLPPHELKKPTPLVGIEIAGVYESKGTTRKLQISLVNEEAIKIECWDSTDGKKYIVDLIEWDKKRGKIKITFFRPSTGYTIRSEFTYLESGMLIESFGIGIAPNFMDHGDLLWVSPTSLITSPLH